MYRYDDNPFIYNCDYPMKQLLDKHMSEQFNVASYFVWDRIEPN